jgi:hypothetical protein
MAVELLHCLHALLMELYTRIYTGGWVLLSFEAIAGIALQVKLVYTPFQFCLISI